MPIEPGKSLEVAELEGLRRQLQQFDRIEAINPDIRAIVERNWPHLMAKLPPADDDLEGDAGIIVGT